MFHFFGPNHILSNVVCLVFCRIEVPSCVDVFRQTPFAFPTLNFLLQYISKLRHLIKPDPGACIRVKQPDAADLASDMMSAMHVYNRLATLC